MSAQSIPLAPLVFSPLEAERMARREWQNPNVLERETVRGKVYYFRYREKRLEDGKIVRVERWRELGLCSEMTKRQAEREKDKVLREINSQVFTVQSQMTWTDFEKLFDENHVAKKATPTQNNYRQQMRTHVAPLWGKLRLCEIGPLQVDQLFTVLEASGVARSTRNTIRGVLGAAFKCARRWKILTASPLDGGVNIGGGPRRVREKRVPTLGQVRDLMAACDGDVPLLIETLYTTG